MSILDTMGVGVSKAGWIRTNNRKLHYFRARDYWSSCTKKNKDGWGGSTAQHYSVRRFNDFTEDRLQKISARDEPLSSYKRVCQKCWVNWIADGRP